MSTNLLPSITFLLKVTGKKNELQANKFSKPSILGLQPRNKAVILVVCWTSLQQNVFLKNLHEIGFSSRRREMLMLLTLTHHQYGCCDTKCKPAIVIHFNLLQVCLFVFDILLIPSSTVVSSCFYVSVNMVVVSSV